MKAYRVLVRHIGNVERCSYGEDETYACPTKTPIHLSTEEMDQVNDALERYNDNHPDDLMPEYVRRPVCDIHIRVLENVLNA